MGRTSKSRIQIFLLITLLLVSGCIQRDTQGNLVPDISTHDWEKARVARVVDGDTLVLDDGRRLRLIGINAPEIGEREEPYGAEASAWLRATIDGKEIFLQKDVSDTDQYGRTLRYVWLSTPEKVDDQSAREWMVSAMMVAQGYAQPYTFPPDVLYADLLLSLAREARTHERGLWAINPDGTTRGSPLD